MPRFHSTLLLFSICLVSLLMPVPSAVAVDGVVLINQGTSVNGLAGCPHSGFPIVICKSGSYRLSGDLKVSGLNTSGITMSDRIISSLKSSI